MKVVQSILVCVLLLSVMVSCEHTVSNKKDDSSLLDWEMITLASEDELNVLLSRGDENIVDWQLSKEFAELWLTYGKENREYPQTSKLLPLPIAIYSSDGSVRFYEFRVVDKDKLVGSIVGAASKEYGCPIVFEGKSSGYSVDLKKLYDTGKLTKEDLPRIVDDGYPSVVIGRTTPSKGVNGEFNEYITLKDGASISKDDIKEVLTYEQAIEVDPDLFKDFSDEDKAKMDAEIAKYKQDAELFWKTAETQKGKVMDFQAKGKAKNDEVTLEKYFNTVKEHIGYRLDNYWFYFYGTTFRKRNDKEVYNYGPCGPVAEGFVLDYLAANGLAPEWKYIGRIKKERILKEVLKVDESGITWPHNVGKAISKYSDFHTRTSGCICPEKAINKGLPGINLRLMKPSSWKEFWKGAHYRAVIAYKKPGWFIFKWWQIKVLDLVDCQNEELQNGRWETYIPLYHFWSWNVLKR